MAEFKSYRAYSDFSKSVAQEWRYTRDSEQRGFLSTLVETSKSRTEELPKGTFLWRAQIGHDSRPSPNKPEEDEDCPFSPQRMKPLKYQASEGRANPKGIPYLYLATAHETAVGEVRPWGGALVSVAMMVLTRSVRIVDCANEKSSLLIYVNEPSASEREKAVWRDINSAFSRPVTPDEKTPDYVPTQVIAETFKREGLDGIAYKSSLGKGTNIVLFDVNAVEVDLCELVRVDQANFSTSQQSIYWLRKAEEILASTN